MNADTPVKEIAIVINPQQLLAHWQGHRRLTRQLIEAFPEDKLFTYSVGGMRPFAMLVQEFLDMAVPGLQGVVTGTWQKAEDMPHYSQTAKLLLKKNCSNAGMKRPNSSIHSGRRYRPIVSRNRTKPLANGKGLSISLSFTG